MTPSGRGLGPVSLVLRKLCVPTACTGISISVPYQGDIWIAMVVAPSPWVPWWSRRIDTPTQCLPPKKRFGEFRCALRGTTWVPAPNVQSVY